MKDTDWETSAIPDRVQSYLGSIKVIGVYIWITDITWGNISTFVNKENECSFPRSTWQW